MLKLFKRKQLDPSQLLKELDPNDRVSEYHRMMMEMQLPTLRIASGSQRIESETLRFLSILLFSRGAIDYLAKYNFPENDDGIQALWAIRQQAIIAEMFAEFLPGDIDKRSELVNVSLGDCSPSSKGYEFARLGFETAHNMRHAVQTGDAKDVGSALADAFSLGQVRPP